MKYVECGVLSASPHAPLWESEPAGAKVFLNVKISSHWTHFSDKKTGNGICLQKYLKFFLTMGQHLNINSNYSHCVPPLAPGELLRGRGGTWNKSWFWVWKGEVPFPCRRSARWCPFAGLVKWEGPQAMGSDFSSRSSPYFMALACAAMSGRFGFPHHE